MDELFERIAVAIYETDEINQMGGKNRIPLRSCHLGHQKRIDNMAQAALNAFNAHKHPERFTVATELVKPIEVLEPHTIGAGGSSQPPETEKEKNGRINAEIDALPLNEIIGPNQTVHLGDDAILPLDEILSTQNLEVEYNSKVFPSEHDKIRMALNPTEMRNTLD